MPARRSSAEVYKWFRKNKKALLANDHSTELSCWRADEIVQSYANLLAKGGRGRIADASQLPYDKETIRAAIDRCIEYLIEQHGGTDVPATPELEERINTLGEAKWTLFNFQDIDPEDREAVAMLNSCLVLSRPVSVDHNDWSEFLSWEIKISLKYSRRAKTEIERLSGDNTITVNRRKSSQNNDSPDGLVSGPQKTSHGIADPTHPTCEEVMAEVKRRMEESRKEDSRSWDEIVTDGKRRWENLKTKS